MKELRAMLTEASSGDEESGSDPHDGEAHEHHELVESMGHMQRYMNKLWFAGEAEHWELADFYTHELEETMEELIEGEIKEDEHNISVLVETMTLPSLERLEEVLKTKDGSAFEGEYLGLVNACNSCHQVTEHAFIQLQKPTTPAFTNQVYKLP